ncbi:194aa long hypothetical protein [Pyrococcus horikoshii OT3]|uniref:Uncharacterized protein n=1 Tax=Pyrococcus horikoshii (strain ATCC 700860 / DSM 12428 / JCM 9974 / NBRC 100139 / OT-3) TaxID=70601 RepID=O50133_PYRHO|nr:194aa long hypothetical protein [Pyrococcus horikoshii OT3]
MVLLNNFPSFWSGYLFNVWLQLHFNSPKNVSGYYYLTLSSKMNIPVRKIFKEGERSLNSLSIPAFYKLLSRVCCNCSLTHCDGNLLEHVSYVSCSEYSWNLSSHVHINWNVTIFICYPQMLNEVRLRLVTYEYEDTIDLLLNRFSRLNVLKNNTLNFVSPLNFGNDCIQDSRDSRLLKPILKYLVSSKFIPSVN